MEYQRQVLMVHLKKAYQAQMQVKERFSKIKVRRSAALRDTSLQHTHMRIITHFVRSHLG